MHEMSLIRNLLQKIESVANENQASKVRGVKVQIGALAHISAGHFREHFEEETVGSIAEGAKLEVEEMSDIHAKDAQEILLKSIDVE